MSRMSETHEVEARVPTFVVPVALLLLGFLLAFAAPAVLFSGFLSAVDGEQAVSARSSLRPWAAAGIGLLAIGAFWLGLRALRRESPVEFKLRSVER